ncbi:MAG: HisA/HisF-related TIM barrel protein, partial [Candidatus Acidiferrum sp.]
MLIPCIDLQRGQAVQLVHGRKRELAVVDVLSLLERFSRYEWLHVIDLDAAMRKGHNNALVRRLCVEAHRKYKMKVRVGGGVRTVRRAQALAKLGVEQVIVGSAAFR